MRFKLASALVVGAAAALLVGCGSSDTASTSTPSTVVSTATSAPATMTTQTTGPMIKTGSAKCTEAAIKKAVADYADAGNEGAVLATGDSDSYRCTDGWLVAQVNVGPAAEAATVTVLWQGEGQFWVPQDRAKVCPKPSKVPASIYDLACNSN